jgi:hypothetical protein
MDKQRILNEIKWTAEANGGTPLGTARFLRETGIKDSDWRGKIWPRWGDALREAGFQPNMLQTAYSEGVLIEKFIGFARELGRLPVATEIKMKARGDDSFPWHNTFARFGSKREFVAKILEYCGDRPGYEDIAALCAPVVARLAGRRKSDDTTEELATDSAASTKEGYVYMGLLKLGREKRYKIGKAVLVRTPDRSDITATPRGLRIGSRHHDGRRLRDRGLLAQAFCGEEHEGRVVFALSTGC